MKTPIASIFFSSLLLSLGLAQSELKPDAQYAAGSRVQASDLGITLSLPKDWPGAYKQEGQQRVLVLGSNSTEGVGLVILLRNQSQTQVVSSLNGSQDLGDGVVLLKDGGLKTQGSRIYGRYQNSQFVGRALALISPAQNHVVLFFAGPKKNEKLYMGLLDTLAQSVRFAAPIAANPQPPQPAPTGLAKQWTQFFSGMVLRYLSSYNSGGGAGGISSDKQLNLCSDGRFIFVNNSMVTINVDGANAAGGGNGQSTGQWRVGSATANGAILILTTDAGQEELEVHYDGQKTFVNGTRWFRIESEVCR